MFIIITFLFHPTPHILFMPQQDLMEHHLPPMPPTELPIINLDEGGLFCNWFTPFVLCKSNKNPQLWNRGGFCQIDKSWTLLNICDGIPTNFGFFHSQPEHGSHAHFVEACVLDSYISLDGSINYYNPYILAITMIWRVFCLKRLQKVRYVTYYRLHYKNGSKNLLSIISHVESCLEHTRGKWLSSPVGRS